MLASGAARLLIHRNKTEFVFTGAALLIIVLVTAGFMVQLTRTLTELRQTAPAFYSEAGALIDDGEFEPALVKIDYALKLDPRNAEFLVRRGHLLQTVPR